MTLSSKNPEKPALRHVSAPNNDVLSPGAIRKPSKINGQALIKGGWYLDYLEVALNDLKGDDFGGEWMHCPCYETTLQNMWGFANGQFFSPPIC